MTGKKWDKLFLFDQPPETPGHPYGSFDFTHMFTLNGNFYPGAVETTCTWYREPIPDWQIYRPHVHNDDEVIGYFGSNTDDPFDLGAEVEINIDGEPYSFEKSCLLFMPQGIEHNPWRIKKMKRPIMVWHMHGLPGPVTWHGLSARDSKWTDYPEYPGREYIKTVKMEDVKYVRPQKYMPVEKPPENKHEKGCYWNNFQFDQAPDIGAHPYGSFDFTHLFTLPNEKIKWANFMFCSLFREPLPDWQIMRPHMHADAEILAYIGMDPDQPFDLGSEVEIYIEDEPYTIDRSCLLYIPPGVAHIPWRIKKMQRPYFSFYIHSSIMSGRAEAPTSRDKRWSHLPLLGY